MSRDYACLFNRFELHTNNVLLFDNQDLLALKEEYTSRPAEEETINDPTNPKHYWRFRVHVTLESLLKDKELKMTIKDLVRGSGRSHPQVDQATAAITSDKQQIAKVQEKNPTVKPLNGVPRKETVAVL
ncbi:hypothetical protein Pint_18428 [Pistacia integerrima]|uniref:Uncharacterized protein n=1 Tax=Pistacia integerrima TaxID=434235 RepID=A0ACC0YZC6_9ROSI|nr:hypothetical protein Pint_18428 [Pistacia integerrima]